MKRFQFNAGSDRSRLACILILTSFFATFLSACGGAPKHKTAEELPPPNEISAPVISPTAPPVAFVPPLTRETALLRSHQIGRVSYSLWIALGGENADFLGRTTIRFDLKPKAQEQSKVIPIDFEGGLLRSITINGTALTDITQPERYNGHQILLKTSELTHGTNLVNIAYMHPYSTTGNGLYRFQDPADHRTYIYSNFEPYNAHRLFPCFDQPDLKATYELTVEAPKDWQVISNTLEREKSVVDGHSSWAFPVTPIFSTYVFALHAGPYATWKGDAAGIPLRLFARKSLAQYVDDREWLKITQEGLDFYGTQFGYPYPFTKYDQIIVPDFNAGAMENVGAITFSENFIYRSRVTVAERRNRASVILHEMAHMWFGDLVTMRWWNGLWLNESFATFASSWALDKSTQFPNVWSGFFSGPKQSAYQADQLITTHPIELPVADTDQAEANFDGITYGKGASILKQLSFYLGEDDFREGLQRYFQKYAFRNSTLGDFIRMLSEASNEDLYVWQQQWIQTQGVNTVRAEWACKDDPETSQSLISEFSLIQSAPQDSLSPGPEQNLLRTHRTQVALFNSPKTRKSLPSRTAAPWVATDPPLIVTYSGPRTNVTAAIGLPCPELVFPNYQDYDYAKIELDPISLARARKNLSKISDPLTRQMLWHTLWEMVIDGKLKPQEYADTVLKELAHENQPEILSDTLSNLVDPAANQNSILKFLDETTRKTYHLKLEVFIRDHLFTAPAGSNEQLIWFKSALRIASSPHSKKLLHELLTKKQKIRGFTIDQDRRWQIIQALARNGTEDAEGLINTELKLDPTDAGQKNAIYAQALIPNSASKTQWLNRILKLPEIRSANTGTAPNPQDASPEETLSFANLRTAMKAFQVVGQEELTQAMVPAYFESLAKLAASPNGTEYAKAFSGWMYPSLCNSDIVEKTSRFLNENPNLPAGMIKSLKMNRQQESRCVQIRKSSL